MPGVGISSLRRPELQHRVDLAVDASDERFFETLLDKLCEDELRIEQFRKVSFSDNKLIAHARRLARQMIIAGRTKINRRAMTSLASSVDMREARIRVTGELWRHYEAVGAESCALATLVPNDGLIAASNLLDFDPCSFKARLRDGLNRAGARDADGTLIAFIHGEFDGRLEAYRMHWHLMATGGMINVVDRLREQRRYQADRLNRETLDGRAWAPVHIQRGPFSNPGRALSYVLKSYWPNRTSWVGPEGDVQRFRGTRRIPEPEHSLYLLWLDLHRLEDICLLMKLRVVDGKLVTCDD